MRKNVPTIKKFLFVDLDYIKSSIDIKDYMDYDPYLGRITENSAAQSQQEG